MDDSNNNNAPSSRPRVQSVARAADILLLIAQNERGFSRKEISSNLKISAQTAYHILHTLTQIGLVSRVDGGNYVLGLRVGSLSEGFKRQLAGAPQVSALIRRVVQETGETSFAARWINDEIVLTDLVRGHHHIQALEVPYGYLDAAYFRSTGKVLLAFASEDVRQLYYRTHEMKSRTPHSVKSFDLLDSQLHDVRSVGYAIDREEFALGVCCVAMPLDGGASPLSIGVSAPTERFDKNFERYLALLKQILANP